MEHVFKLILIISFVRIDPTGFLKVIEMFVNFNYKDEEKSHFVSGVDGNHQFNDSIIEWDRAI